MMYNYTDVSWPSILNKMQWYTDIPESSSRPQLNMLLEIEEEVITRQDYCIERVVDALNKIYARIGIDLYIEKINVINYLKPYYSDPEAGYNTSVDRHGLWTAVSEEYNKRRDSGWHGVCALMLADNAGGYGGMYFSETNSFGSLYVTCDWNYNALNHPEKPFWELHTVRKLAHEIAHHLGASDRWTEKDEGWKDPETGKIFIMSQNALYVSQTCDSAFYTFDYLIFSGHTVQEMYAKAQTLQLMQNFPALLTVNGKFVFGAVPGKTYGYCFASDKKLLDVITVENPEGGGGSITYHLENSGVPYTKTYRELSFTLHQKDNQYKGLYVMIGVVEDDNGKVTTTNPVIIWKSLKFA